MSGDYTGELVTEGQTEFSINSGSWNHQYLWSIFPQYDYNNPTERWKINCNNSEGIRLCAWQMKAFHYWWIVNQCYYSGEIGLAINIDNLPFCLHVDSRDKQGHIFAASQSAHKLFSNANAQFPLVIASALIPYYPCDGKVAKCEGVEIVGALDRLASIIKPSGILVAAIMDETGPRHEGRSLKESAHYTHTWTVKNFERKILNSLSKKSWDIYEFDTFKNDMSYNLVLRRK